MVCRNRTLPILLVSLIAVLVGSAVAWAATSTQSATADGVTATFSFSGSALAVSNAHLRIVRGGQTAYDQPVLSPACGSQCGPAAFGAHQQSVRVIRLAPGSQPAVVLELFSGGANCCFVDQVFDYSLITRTYMKVEHDFVAAGAQLRRLGSARRWRFISADDAFKYEFTDGAHSGEPIQIWSFAGRAFHNVTRGYPKLIAIDAARWLTQFRRHLDNGVGLIAAWAADEELLGRDKLVQSTLTTEAQHGNLRDAGGSTNGPRFVKALNRVLHQLGYRR